MEVIERRKRKWIWKKKAEVNIKKESGSERKKKAEVNKKTKRKWMKKKAEVNIKEENWSERKKKGEKEKWFIRKKKFFFLSALSKLCGGEKEGLFPADSIGNKMLK